MVKVKFVPVTVGPVRLCIVPLGLKSCADTISNGSSDSITDKPNSTVQVTMTEDPLLTILSLLVTVTDCGAGTVGIEYECHYATHIGLMNSL